MPSVFQQALDAVFGSVIGVDATFSICTDSIRVVDKTRGVEVTIEQFAVPQLMPVVSVRASSLAEQGIDPDDLIGTTVTLNSRTWRIVNHKQMPTPDGDGEYYLILRDPS